MKDTRLYYEAHITVQPGTDFETFIKWAEERDWKASKFDVDMVDDATDMWFLSARSESKAFILGSTIGAVQALNAGSIVPYPILRWKIEETVWDSKYGDTFEDAMKDIRK